MHTQQTKPHSDITSIAIIQFKGLGDLVFTLPMIQTLKYYYQKAHITLITGEWQKRFTPEHIPAVDEVVAIPDFESFPLLLKQVNQAPYKEILKLLVDKHFDMVFQLEGPIETANDFVQLLKPTYTVGFSKKHTKKLNQSFPFPDTMHEVYRYLDMLQLVIPPTYGVSLYPEIVVNKKDWERVPFVNEEKQYVVIHPGAGDIRRMWPLENYLTVVDALHRKGLRLMATGSLEELNTVTNLLARTDVPIYNAAGTLSLPELTGTLMKAQLVITNDTGPLHLARALGTKTIGLFTARHFARSSPQRAKGQYSLVSIISTCPLCGSDIMSADWPEPISPGSLAEPLKPSKRSLAPDRCLHATSLLSDIHPDEVLAVVDDLLHGPLHQGK